MSTWTIVAIVVGVLLVGIGWMYNRLVTLKQRVDNAWSQIDVQLKRRHDLIPNLVETAKSYMEHEQETLKKVTQARQQAVDADTLEDRADAEDNLTGSLKRLFAVSEDYPELKASENMLSLQEELASTENKIGFARQHYNDSVMQLNEKIQKFPSNIIAGVFGFETREFFEIEDSAAREVPEVDVGNES